MPRKTLYKQQQDTAVNARRAGISALQKASEGLPKVVEMYLSMLKRRRMRRRWTCLGLGLGNGTQCIQ
ncbi:hypothetical protein AGMMS49992_10470 [Clostridia bacterium]|nr:hypothetical protein AGMMS49992_10470 [Clostridia bacterium]